MGQAAVAVEGTDPVGDVAHHNMATPGGTTLLLFLTSSCTPCQGFWQRLAEPGPARLNGVDAIVIITPGDALESRPKVAELAPSQVPVVMSGQAWADYEVTGSPSAVLIEHGVVAAEGAVLDWEALVALVG